MSQSYVLASVGNIELIDKSNGEIVATSKTLTESGIQFSVTAEDIRGGMANKLLAQYFHDSNMTLKLTDALFNLNYLALNVGGSISVGGDVMTVEQVVTTTPNEIEITNEPRPFLNLGEIGWYSIAGKDEWTKISFNKSTKKASVAELPVGTTVCVKYIKRDETIEEFTVSSSFVPSQCYALLTLPLFKSGTDTKQFSNSSRAGEVQVEIPTFLLAGAQELSLTASGASTTSLSGSALATFNGSQSCDSEDGYYAKLKQITFNKNEFDDMRSIVIADSDVTLANDETQQLQVYGIYGGNVLPKLIDNSKLTFVADGASATVSTSGLVTADTSSKGKTTIEVTVTDKTELSAQCVVTVS